MAETLLVELLTEELPPKALTRLASEFSDQIHTGLHISNLVDSTSNSTFFATPRRIAAKITNVSDRAKDREHEVAGPSASAPPQAIAGFAKKHSVSVDALLRRSSPKGEIVVAKVLSKGTSLDAVLVSIIEKVLKGLPVPKMMRWGSGEEQFVRPVHGLVMLHGKRVVPGTVLGLKSGNHTLGHRFMSKGPITLASADEYEKTLLDQYVIADFERRKKEIETALQAAAGKEKGSLGEYESLLDEVTALVEHPSVYVGSFDASFLAVPQECLILTMRQNQKYFPLFDSAGKLLPKFLIVSNMKLADPRHIVGGNQRVVRPRLEDARFFYDQDRKTRLEARVPQLAKVVYHNKLGSQLERVQRVKLLAGKIARVLGADVLQAERAAELAKADLLTGMVGEFPELQGVMGRYYALHDGEPIACAVALADKLDAIAGLFSIGQQPTGEKDPFGLRRAALGVVRILVENKLRLSLKELIHAAFEPFPAKPHTDLRDFIFDRFAGYLKEQGYSTLQVDAVLSKQPVNLSVVPQQLEAVKAFQSLPEAESLAAANKRVANILKQAEAKGEILDGLEAGTLKEPAERALLDAIRSVSNQAKVLYEKGDYTGYLKSFAVLKAPVDAFFDKVMVMVEDEKLRRGRLALLRDLREAMNRVADLSKLAA
jgi:glycyl-tRNA synthetase beta chain